MTAGAPVAPLDRADEPVLRTATAEVVRPWRLLLASCVGLAVLSFLLPSEPTYDPWAWIIWGREITEADLSTVDGPSWKPLPVLFTTVFAFFGDTVAPNLWLVVARVGGLLAIAMTYRLASRLGGRWAGLLAAASLLVADQFIRNFMRGNSEGLLVALCLWAVERHLDGRRTDAFALGLGAALLRPEVWPFFGLYGLWLAYLEPRRRWLVGAGFAACGLLWFVPEWFGSGNFLRAAERARNPNPDSAAFAAVPFVEVFVRSSVVLAAPVLVGAVVAMVAAWRTRGRPESRVALALGAVAGVLMIGVAAMTQGGFAGNLRYVALPAALVCILAGLGWVGLVRAVGRRWGGRAAGASAVAIALAWTPFAVSDVLALADGYDRVRHEADFYGALPRVIADHAGGRERVVACGGVFTGDFQVPGLAYYLHLHGSQISIPPAVRPPGTIFAPRHHTLEGDRRFPLRGQTAKWIVRQSCA